MKNEFLRRFMQIDRVLDTRDTHTGTQSNIYFKYFGNVKKVQRCVSGRWGIKRGLELNAISQLGCYSHGSKGYRADAWTGWFTGHAGHWGRALSHRLCKQTIHEERNLPFPPQLQFVLDEESKHHVIFVPKCVTICNSNTYSSKINTIDSLYKVREGNTLETSLFVGGMVLNMIYKCSAIAET